MYLWLFNVCIYGLCSARGNCSGANECLKRLKLLLANGGMFEINQLFFSDDSGLVADSEEKLCRMVCEFGRV